MTDAQLIAYITTWIKTNANQEITGAVLQPVLLAIEQRRKDVTGNLSDLATTANTNLVSAINEVFNLLPPGSAGVKLHTGTANPNTTPPASFSYADFYMLVDINNFPISLYQYNGFNWVLGGGTTPNLQQVTAAGATTTINTTFAGGAVIGDGTYAFLALAAGVGGHIEDDGGALSIVKNTSTGSCSLGMIPITTNVFFALPTAKPSGVYTLATLDDIPAGALPTSRIPFGDASGLPTSSDELSFGGGRLVIAPTGFDSLLFGKVYGGNVAGLYSNNGDQILTDFNPTTNIYRYANGNIVNDAAAQTTNLIAANGVQVNGVAIGVGYKSFVAKSTQTGTDAPVITVLKNELAAFTAGYNDVGVYSINFVSSVMPDAAKVTTIQDSLVNGVGVVFGGLHGVFDDNLTYKLYTSDLAGTPTDGQISNKTIEFRVYD